MNLTDGRDPAATAAAIEYMKGTAAQNALAPFHLHIGFFQVRDLMKLNPLVTMHPVDGEGRRSYCGLPYFIHGLQDGLHMCCRQVGNPNGPVIFISFRPITSG